MNRPERLDRLQHLHILFEGEEDLTIRPWRRPLRLLRPATIERGSPNVECVNLLIEGEEDLTVRPAPNRLCVGRD